MTIDNGDDNEDRNILVVEADCSERYPYVILEGCSANLSALRGTDEQTRSSFFDERCMDISQQPVLLMESSMFISLAITIENSGVDVTSDDNISRNNDENNRSNISGEIFVTNKQVLFVATERDESQYDLAIGAACIILHAMTDEPELSVYLQLNRNCDEEGVQRTQQESPPTEVTFTPVHNNNDNNCQILFNSLCRLVSLHPIEVDEDDGNNEQGNEIFGYGRENFDIDDGTDDGFIWAPASSNDTMTNVVSTGDGGEVVDDDDPMTAATNERDVMLDRLDKLLVVRSEFEITEDGQFDDADDD